MIQFIIINISEFNERIKNFDAKIEYVKTKFNYELKSYGNIIRISLNAIQEESINNLIERVVINKELERALENAGGYSMEYLGENNPKTELIGLLLFLKKNLPKQTQLFDFLENSARREIIVSDNYDIEFVKQQFKNSRLEVIPFSELKKNNLQNKTLVFLSFNGQKDFDLIYNIDCDIVLILYEQEYNLYQNKLSQRKKLIEDEINSRARLEICGVTYYNHPEEPITISTTIENIVGRLDDWSTRAYEGYKNECDLLLSEIEEKIIYKISSDRATFYLDSNDTVFNQKGDLIKGYKINIGERIRIYPKEQLAENLYQVAVETEPDVFGKVEEHSAYWKQHVIELRNIYGDEVLYKKLKEKGLRILQATLESYGKGDRKFPMFNNDLRVILKLYYPSKTDYEIDVILKPILKSKTIYNSTMIVLGRGLKQELRLFLKEKRIGEILVKRSFNANTLQSFIDEYMPLNSIIHKELFNEELEVLDTEVLFQQIEL